MVRVVEVAHQGYCSPYSHSGTLLVAETALEQSLDSAAVVLVLVAQHT